MLLRMFPTLLYKIDLVIIERYCTSGPSYLGCINTEWFDLDNPAHKGDHESVGQVFNYLAEQNNKHVHRSCSMKNIHYPVELLTTQGHGNVENSFHTKTSHSVECVNYEGFKELDLKTQKKIKPGPPYYWDMENVTCRDWKIRYCCENLWGEPGLYGLLERKAEKPVPEYISETDVFVDKPTRKNLFEDCKWRNFVRYCAKNLIYILFFYCNCNISMNY